jgi:hypothetical protein
MLDPVQPAVGTIDHLGRLVARTALGDRAAFRCLYAFQVMSVWRATDRALFDPGDALAATRSTFVELWHLARYRRADPHLDHGAWVTAIAAGRVDERTRIRAGFGVNVDVDVDLDDYDAHVHRELRDLLGSGRAVIRTGPRTFASVDDLDSALGALAALAGPSRKSVRHLVQVG